jgi:RNA-directed DNA polymerase
MEWGSYQEKFRDKALNSGYTEEEIDKCLIYANKLYNNRIPIIFDQVHLSLLVGYSEGYLRRASNSPNSFYRCFKIAKKSGGEREIAEPLPSLKEIQYWILTEILYKCRVSRYAKAYIPKRSIKDNAKYHINQKIVLSIDIVDFFGSLSYTKVYQFFRNLGYARPVSTILSNLCCRKGSLPQGAPTSPALSNLLMDRVDKRIIGFTKKNKIRYTRYADDMTFSGNFDPGMVIKFVRSTLEDENLKVNEGKIRVRQQHQRQEVTGIVVNKKLQAPKELRNKLRQAVYYIEKYGLSSHLDRTKNLKANHILHLMGIANFIIFINQSDNEAIQYITILKKYLPNILPDHNPMD